MKGKPGFIPAHTAMVARRRREQSSKNRNDMKNKNGVKDRLQSAMTKGLEKVPFILFNSDSLVKYEEQKARVVSEYGFLPKRKPTILDGSVLPKRYEPVPSYFYGKPIEELENGIYEKTFCVISTHFSKHYLNRVSATNSFFIFSPWNFIRKTCVYLVTNQYFDYLMILTILVNCVFLALSSPIEQAEYVFLSIYTTEMLIKSIAKGFILNKYTYLRNPWNWLDFVVILLGFVTIGVDLGQFAGLRTFRVLRALKTVSILPGLKTIVNALLHSVKMLSEVMLLTVFCLMVFALFALQIYVGTLRNKCVENFSGPRNLTDDEYHNYTQNKDHWLKDTEADGEPYFVCGNASGTLQCKENYTCLPGIGDNPNNGYTSFDDFGSAMLNTFQLITLDFWEDIYNKVIGTSGPIHLIYFVIVVFFGSFYLINLMLAVVAMAYEEEAEATQLEIDMDRMEAENSKSNNSQQQQQAKKGKKKRIITRRGAITITDPAISDTEMDPNELPPSDSVPPADLAIAFPAPLQRAIGLLDEAQRPDTQATLNNTKTPNRPTTNSEGFGIPYSRYNNVMSEGVNKRLNTATRQPVKNNESTICNNCGLKSCDKNNCTLAVGIPCVPTSENGPKELVVDNNAINSMNNNASDVSASVLISRDSEASTDTNNYQIALTELNKTVSSIPEDDLPREKMKVIEDPYPDRNCICCSHYCIRYSLWLRFQKFIYIIVSDPLVELFITACIIVNTCFLAIEHANMNDSLKEILSTGNKVFTAIFTLETALKLIATSKEYFRKSWNVFDLIIVVFSLIELGLEGINGLSVLRALRLLRVFKLAQSWTTMRVLLVIIVRTLGALGNLTFVLVIIMYIFAIIGMQLFGKDYKDKQDKFPDGEIPRWNFTDFIHSFMMIFRVLCGEWIEPMWDCMLVSGGWCMAIFIPSLVVGNFMVLNLFLALLLSSFNSEALSENNKKDEEMSKLAVGVRRLKFLFCCCCNFVKSRRQKKRSDSVKTILNHEPDVIVRPDVVPESAFINHAFRDDDGRVRPRSSPMDARGIGYDNRRMTVAAIEEVQDESDDERKPTWSPVVDYVSNLRHGSLESLQLNDTLLQVAIYGDKKADAATQTGEEQSQATSARQTRPTSEISIIEVSSAKLPREIRNEVIEKAIADAEEGEEEIPLAERDPEDCFPHFFYKKCCCCKHILTTKLAGQWFQFRKRAIRIVDHWLFEWTVIFIIIISSVCLCFEDIYLDENIVLKTALRHLNLIFCIIYTLEMLLKWLAHGFVVYFSSGWSLLDFIIVAASILSVVADGNKNLVALRSVRTLRALRPLRAISRWQGMKIVVNALMSAIPAIFNVLLVCIIFWLIFSIMGVQFFAGRFYKCTNNDERVNVSEVNNKTQCAEKNYTWENEKINFDNVGQGYLALFQVATFEGWMEIMEAAVDSRGVDLQPDTEANLPAYLYFIVFIVCGSFFTLNLFIGVIIDNFNMLKKKYEGGVINIFLTENQKNYYAAMKKLGRKKPQKLIRRPTNKILAAFYDLSMSRRFEMFIFFIIVLNMICMGIDSYNQSKETEKILDLLNVTFTSIFAVEAIIKIIGLRHYYFTVPWNVFDFLLVISSIIGIVIKRFTTNALISPTLLRVVRVFRIGRILRLIKAAKGIRKLLFALVVSLPALFNIGALIFLIMFIYAIIGMSFFSRVKKTPPLNDVVNFETFGRSMLLLFRLLTSAGWNDILEPLMIQEPKCDPHEGNYANGNCGSPTLAIIYLVSYVIINFMIIINMYIAVILENFNQAHQEEELGIVEDDLEMFYMNWAKYDPRASQFISFWQLSDFVDTLDQPLRIPKPNSIAIASFNLPIAKGMKLHCLDILHALVKHVLGHVEETGDFQKLRSQMEEKFKKQFPTRKQLEMVTTTLQWKRYEFAARVVQKAYRNHTARRRRIAEGGKDRPKSRIGNGLRTLSQYFALPSRPRPSSAASARAPSSKPPHNKENGDVDNKLSVPTQPTT